MAKNIMSLVNLTNKVSRNGFDLGQRVAFTAKVGELLPVSVTECIPGDKFKLDLSWFTRTQPLNTAAYTRVKEYVDVFFVPTNLLWNRFNTFVTRMNMNAQQAENISEILQVPTQHPYFSWFDVYSYMLTGMSNLFNHSSDYSDYVDVVGQPRVLQTFKLLNYLGYGKFFSTTGFPVDPSGTGKDVVLNPFPLLAYQKIYYDFYRDQQWEGSLPYCFNVNYAGNPSGGASAALKLPVTDLNWTEDNMFTLRYCNFAKDYFLGLLPEAQFGDAAAVTLGETGSDPESVLLTYLSPTNYSASSGNGIGLPVSFGSGNNVPGFGATESAPSAGMKWPVGASPSDVPSTLYIRNVDGSKKDDWQALQQKVLTSVGDLSGSFTILALRRAEAAQKWAEITQSNQQDYKHQIAAHFEKNVSDAYSEHVKWLGGTSSVLDISEVVNTNLNAGEDNVSTNNASISGKGAGTGNGNIQFEAPVHGIIMAIYHAEPVLDYDLNGIDKFNLKSMPTDYAVPEYDRTGMVAVPQIEFALGYKTGSTTYDYSKPLGYGLQYQEYKTKYDKILGAFSDGGLQSWVTPMTSDYYLEVLKKNNYAFTYQMKKVNPSVMDSVFAVNALPDVPLNNGTDQAAIQAAYQSEVGTDQLLVNMFVGMSAVRPLDRNGLPY